MHVDNWGEIKTLSEEHGNARAICGKIEVLHDYDEHGDIENILISDEDANRRETFHRGEWHYIGIRTKATIYLPDGDGSFKVETISSGGLWGVESDSDVSYLESIAKEERDTLMRYLKMLNVVTTLVE